MAGVQISKLLRGWLVESRELGFAIREDGQEEQHQQERRRQAKRTSATVEAKKHMG